MFKKLLIGFIALLLTACTDAPTATRALQDMGFTDISITEYHWFSCPKENIFSTGFMAKNTQGRYVSGTVCSNLFFKGAIIQFN